MSEEGILDMDVFLSLAKTVANDTDEAGRKKVLDILRDVAYSIESPEDTIQRVMFYVSNRGQSITAGDELKFINSVRTCRSQAFV